MALSAQQIQQIANQQGGGFQLYDMIREGTVTIDEVRAAVGSEAIDSFLARNNLQPPAPSLNQSLPPTSTTQAVPTSQAPVTTGSPTGAGAPTPSYTPPTNTTQTAPAPVATPQAAPAPAAPTGNAGGYLTPGSSTGIQENNDYSRYPTPIPSTPNYEGAANAQGTANLQAAKNTVALSNPNQITPFGSQTYTIGPDGRPIQTQQFSEDLQQRLFDLNSILPSVTNQIKTQTGKGLDTSGLQSIMDLEGFNLPDVMDLNNIELPEVMDLSNLSLPARTTQTGVQGQSAVAEALRQREQPRFDRKRQQVESQLLARGFNPGTEGWDEAIDDISRQQNDFDLGLTALSGQEQSRLFNLDTENRNTRRAELNDLFSAQSKKRSDRVSELSTLFGAQSQNRASRVNELQTLFNAQNTKRANQLNEQVLGQTLPIQQYQQLIQAMQPQLPQFQQYSGATVDAAPIFNGINAQGIFDLGRYGTSITGELGTRGIDASKSAANTGFALQALGLNGN